MSLKNARVMAIYAGALILSCAEADGLDLYRFEYLGPLAPTKPIQPGPDGFVYWTTPNFNLWASTLTSIQRSNFLGGPIESVVTERFFWRQTEFPDGLQTRTSDGTVFGASAQGGAFGGGTVYKETPGQERRIIHSFNGNDRSTGGYWPNSRLLEATNGMLYGTTWWGGPLSWSGLGSGTVFRIAKDGTGFATIASFPGVARWGSTPDGQLIQASDGYIYGDAGLIFRLHPERHTYGLDDGGGRSWVVSRPGLRGLFEGADGALYGMGVLPASPNPPSWQLMRVAKTGTSREPIEDGAPHRSLIDMMMAEGQDGNIYGLLEPSVGPAGIYRWRPIPDRLRVVEEFGGVLVAWHTNTTGSVARSLQHSASGDLTAPLWEDVPSSLLTSSNGFIRLRISGSLPGGRFFRLAPRDDAR